MTDRLSTSRQDSSHSQKLYKSGNSLVGIRQEREPLVTEQTAFPDFFVIGAPRCGTTSLCRYLARNPQVCFSRPKEPHYFSRLNAAPGLDEVRRDYLDTCFGHFEPAVHRSVGEGSVSYLYLPHAIEHARSLNPEARFIAMVRNPLTMLPSYHQRMLFLLQENETDFARAWALEAERTRGRCLPRRCLDPRLLMYSKVAELGAQVEQLFGIAGQDHCKVIVFDDLVSDPLAVYRDVLGFLGVDYDGQTRFEQRYESRMYRSRWLQRLLFVPVARGGKIIDTVQRRTRKYNEDGSKQPTLLKKITGLNKVSSPPAPLSPEMIDVVRASLRDDVSRLAGLLDRDLGFWFD